MRKLDGKAVLVTGAGSGIGASVARVFAGEGAMVGVLDIDQQAAEQVVDEIHQAGGKGVALQADIRRAEDVEQSIERMHVQFGRFDILINNAAVQIMGPLHECTEADFQQMIDVNLKGVFLGCKYALPIMMKQRSGVILTTSSVLGVVGDSDLPVYGATKGAVIGLDQVNGCRLRTIWHSCQLHMSWRRANAHG